MGKTALFSKTHSKFKVIALLVAFITVLVYLPALQNDFVNWDDDKYIYENPGIRTIDKESLKWMFTSFHAANWHPVTWFSHAVDYAVWGLNPLGHHLTSVVLHGINSFLVVVLVAVLIGIAEKIRNPKSEIRNQLIAAGVTGLLFGLHPVHVESVAWVSERKDVLCALFFLLSILSYIKYTQETGYGSRVTRYGLSLLFFILALMSKPMAVTLPLVLVILDVYPLERWSIRKKPGVLTEKVPFIVLSIASSVVTVMAQKAGGAIQSLEVHPFPERLLVGIKAPVFYLYKMLWPSGLAPLYPYPYPHDISFISVKYMGAFMVIAGITAYSTWLWKRQKVVLVVWAYYLIMLLPVLGIVQVGDQAAADRYTYLPGLGPFFMAGLAAAWLVETTASRRDLLKSVYFVIVPGLFIYVLLSYLTVNQIKVWKDSITLWDRTIEKLSVAPHNIYYNRGKAFQDQKEYQKAIDDYNRSIELNPGFADAFINRGTVFQAVGNYEKAIDSYNRAAELDSKSADIYYNRGISYTKLGNYQQAINDYTTTIALNPEDSIAFNNRGVLYGMLGKYKRSIEDFNTLIRLNPEYSEAYYNRGNSYVNLGDYNLAMQDFNSVIKLDPENIKAYTRRGVAYFKLGDKQSAIKDFQAAARLGDKRAQEFLMDKGIHW